MLERLPTVHATPLGVLKIGPACWWSIAVCGVRPKVLPIGMTRGSPVLRAVLCSVSVIVRFDQSTSAIWARQISPGRAPDCAKSGKMLNIWHFFPDSVDLFSISQQIRIVAREARRG